MKANDEQASSKQSASSSKSKVPLPVGHMTQATMRVLENIGFTSAQQSCVYSLSSMMRNYFERLCNAANASADHAGRESLILEDANIAFKTMGVNITELHDYIREVNCFTTDLNVPLFPVSKSTTARFVPNKKIATEEKSASTLLNATDQAENAIKKKSTDEEMQRCEDQTSDIKRSLISPAPVADQRPASSLNKEFHRSQKQFPSFFGAKANQLGFVVVVPPKPKIEHPVKSAHHGNVPKVQPPKVPITFQMPPHRPTPDRPVQDRLAAAIMKMTTNKIPDRPIAITEIKQPDATDESSPAAPPKEVAKPAAPDLPKPPEQKPVRVERREPPPRMEPEAEKAGPSRPVVVEKEEPKVEVLKNVIQESDSKVVIRAVDIQPKAESLKLKTSSGKVQKQKSVETEKAIIPPAVEVATFIPDLLPMLAEDEAHIPSPEEPRVPKLTIKFGPKITTSATPIVSVEAIASVVDPMPASRCGEKNDHYDK
ncbi:bromodomain associated domain-containing protein [Ditylenchus destructor]|nr:bromodomain associated domain-containing protein [Ditylenchus destructor]